MRAVVQRVTRASVTVDGEVIGEIENGLVVLVGIARDDTKVEAAYLVDKISNLRIFDDDEGKMNSGYIVTDTKRAKALVKRLERFTGEAHSA